MASVTEQTKDSATIVFDGEFLPAIFRTQSFEIARDSVRFMCRGDDYQIAPSKMALIMRNLVEDALCSSSSKMTDMAKMLDITKRDQLHILTDVADEMFEDQQVNWGRIVTLHAFCGCLARYCEQTNIPDCAEDVANILADFVINRLGLWIVTHGGWAAFELQIPLISWISGGMWKGIAVITLIVGALYAFYSSVQFMSRAGS